MIDYNALGIEELGPYASDYHKDVFGYRPKVFGLYYNKALLVALIISIDEYIDNECSTEEGRQRLSNNGWTYSFC